MNLTQYILTLLLVCSISTIEAQDSWSGRLAVPVNTILLFSDSSFSAPTQVRVQPDEWLRVLGQTRTLQGDGDQQQLFHWYQVEKKDGKTGWVFGEEVVVMDDAIRLPVTLRPYHEKKYDFGGRFGPALVWVGSIRGFDGQIDRQGNPYEENYLLFTAQNGQTIRHLIGRQIDQNRAYLRHLEILDITDDSYPEILLIAARTEGQQLIEDREMEILSIQGKRLQALFSEDLNLYASGRQPAHMPYKHIEVDNKAIRFDYLAFVPCSQYHLAYDFDNQNSQREQCLELVTYTYRWQDALQRFEILYQPSYQAPLARSKSSTTPVKASPRLGAKAVGVTPLDEPLKVIKKYEKNVLIQGKRKQVKLLFIELPDGRKGYVPAEKLEFIDFPQAKYLNDFFQKGSHPSASAGPSFFDIRLEEVPAAYEER